MTALHPQRLKVLLLCLTACVLQGTVAAQQIDYSGFKGESLGTVLRYLDSRYNFDFSYDPNAIRGITIPERALQATSVEQFLAAVLEESTFTWERIEGTYLIIPRAGPDAPSANQRLSVSGTVRDKLSREALPYATVRIERSDLTATTNTDGKFTLLEVPNDTLQIEVSYLGYERATLPIVLRSDVNLTIELLPAQRNLPSVEVTAAAQQMLEIAPKASQFTLNPAEIVKLPNLGEQDLFAALRWVPGIRGAQEGTSGLQVRGGGSDQNLILFDGIPVYHVDHFFGLLSAFNSKVVKNVQVSKGGFGAPYGGRASGLVNITAIDGNKLKPSLSLGLSALSANALLELPLIANKASLVLAYRRAFTDIIQTPTYRRMFRNIFNASVPGNVAGGVDVFASESSPDFSFSDFNAKFNFKPSSKDALSFNYYQGTDQVNILFDGRLQTFRRQSQDDTQWGTRGGSFKWSRKWSKRFFTYANLGISRYRSTLEAEESIRIIETDSLLSEVFFEQETRVSDNTLRLDNSFKLGAFSTLNFGYWYTDYLISARSQDQFNLLTDTAQHARLHAGYAELEHQWGGLSLEGGLRVSQYTLLQRAYVEPRLSATYKLSDAWTFKGAYGVYNQFIRRLNERSLYFSVPESWALSAERIPVLRSDHYILGLTWRRSEWTIDLEGYHKFERGAVEYLYPGIGNPTDLADFGINGRRRIFGADLLLKRQMGRHRVVLGYSYLNSDSQYPGINDGRYFRSAFLSDHEFNVVYQFDYGRWDISAGFIAAQGSPYTPVLGTFVITLPSGEEAQFLSLGAINSRRLDWYHRMDLSVVYTLPLKKSIVQVGASVYNLYNHLAIKYVDYFAIPQVDSPLFKLGQRNIATLGITPSVFLTWRL